MGVKGQRLMYRIFGFGLLAYAIFILWHSFQQIYLLDTQAAIVRAGVCVVMALCGLLLVRKSEEPSV